MSVEEGLKSTDVEIIKSARGSAKGKVSKYVKALDNVLLRDGETFLLEEIDHDRAEKVYESLNTSSEEFQELHDRYHRYAEETTALKQDVETKYLSELDEAYSGAVKLYAGYRKAQKLSLRKTKIKLLESKISSLKECVVTEVSAAKELLESSNENVKKTARTVKNELRSTFESYDSKVNELLELKVESQEPEDKHSTITGDRTDIIKEVRSLCMELEAIAVSIGPVSSGSSRGADNSIVKLQKLKCPKFSGVPRDFGQFKRDFEQIVNVPGRSDVEIGSNLKDAIPERFQHLVSHLDKSNHPEMMTILEKKFGTKNLVVQDIIAQLEKMKVVTTDKMFIEFVEKLQKIKLDLDSLNQTGEIANASCMGKIEERLPLCVSTDWWKIVVKNNLDDGSSAERYKALMRFLDEEKERVERQTTSMNKISGPGVVKTVTNCVTGSISLPANAGDKLGLSWAKLSCQLGSDCTVINICCLIVLDRK